MNSDFLKLNWNDIGKGLLLAAIVAGINFVKPIFESGSYHIDWHLFLNTECMAVGSYLLKQFGTNSNGQIGK